ncbi:unnamed protein product [Didymodactylos carnosus]|uniref:T4 RNA ligase 1-like N-terminal domain-containing protein n=1 Tax=Didymodactylos carnosus TaxID=1234261 RepID=A0A815XEF1_9BILA|nr:unnamed protein product [Didymodactylos carnosus]CAF1556464.1 unnamed protein product [Didymodactylos carnosus]CAF3759790.1 unnamed protein product [Didymodactylos carnosus]CAF4417632.1 unnamed protein product [Didymodactylos carnosus]
MMSTYSNLMSLVEDDHGFYFKDCELDSCRYRIFNYHLPTWSSFQKPSALECRGIMYDITNDPRLVCLPPQKFFNYEEGDRKHALGQLGDKMMKIDGSLISTYLHQNKELRLKSKASVTSTQAHCAMQLLTGKFKEEVTCLGTKYPKTDVTPGCRAALKFYN